MDTQRDVFKKIQIVRGNIATTEAEAVVNSTDTAFSASGGIDFAIHKAAGMGLRAELHSRRKLEEGQSLMTPAFEMKTAKKIIHTVGPKWINGFRGEEQKLANCYRSSLKLAMEDRCGSIAFPCIGIGKNGFPENRAAEIAINAVYYMLRAKADSELPKVLFVCRSEQQEMLYKNQLKRRILEEFLHLYSPESYHDFPDTVKYYSFMFLLGELEWGDGYKYDHYCSGFNRGSDDEIPGKYTQYDKYALNMDKWDYSTCLAYIIFLQRSAYWSGGTEYPHFDQWSNGTVRKVLLRMLTLLP